MTQNRDENCKILYTLLKYQIDLKWYDNQIVETPLEIPNVHSVKSTADDLAFGIQQVQRKHHFFLQPSMSVSVDKYRRFIVFLNLFSQLSPYLFNYLFNYVFWGTLLPTSNCDRVFTNFLDPFILLIGHLVHQMQEKQRSFDFSLKSDPRWQKYFLR